MGHTRSDVLNLVILRFGERVIINCLYKFVNEPFYTLNLGSLHYTTSNKYVSDKNHEIMVGCKQVSEAANKDSEMSEHCACVLPECDAQRTRCWQAVAASHHGHFAISLMDPDGLQSNAFQNRCHT